MHVRCGVVWGAGWYGPYVRFRVVGVCACMCDAEWCGVRVGMDLRVVQGGGWVCMHVRCGVVWGAGWYGPTCCAGWWGCAHACAMRGGMGCGLVWAYVRLRVVGVCACMCDAEWYGVWAGMVCGLVWAYVRWSRVLSFEFSRVAWVREGGVAWVAGM